MKSNYGTKEYGRNQLILEQIERTNIIISGFKVSGQMIEAKLNWINTEEARQKGKEIANAVLCLEANVFKDLTKEFLEDEYIQGYRDFAFMTIKEFNQKYFPKEKADYSDKIIMPMGFENANIRKPYEGKRYMHPDLEAQQEGVEAIITYFRYLVAFIYGLPEFANKTAVVEDDMTFEEGKDADN